MDPMKYTMDELVRALVLQTMGEVALDESELVADNEYDVLQTIYIINLEALDQAQK